MCDKKQLSEEDIKLQFITPALEHAGWDKQHIRMEYAFTDGRIIFQGQSSHARKAKKFADYLLQAEPNKFPIAIVEAKDNNHPISGGIGQAKTYAEILDLKFAYSSNGDGFTEYDFITGQEKNLSLDEFPTPEQLKERLQKAQGMTPEAQKIVETPYYFDAYSHEPRYYQRIAIDRTVEAVAKGQDRILIVMATGTGKTFTSFQIIHRLTKSGAKKKVLYLADRNVLIDQTMTQDFRPFKSRMTKIQNRNMDSSYEIYMALYQQLVSSEEDKPNPFTEFQPSFFDLIIVDECHRGSAKKDSNWRKILEYFNTATQIGMTATPKETKYISNIDYFGKPIYTYSLREGIDDGFLAPFRVVGITLNIGEGWRPKKGQVDVYGNEIEDRIYNNSDYDYNIIIEDRIREVAHEITQYLKSTDRMAKTIVFCADEEHADRMRTALVNENSDMCQKNPDYVVRITGSDPYGQSKLDYFISVASKYPVIATTSKLLSTGVDCKMVKLIVLDQRINSMTEFKQIVGRGTRIREKEGKTHFTIMDFRNITRLFADPDWDGPLEVDEGFVPKGSSPYPPQEPQPSGVKEEVQKVEKPIVDRDGCHVRIINKVVSVYDANGKLLRTESITDYTRKNINDTYANLDDFILHWNAAEKKAEITDLMRESGIDLQALKHERDMDEVDDFDFICHIAYGKKPLTRRERAESVKKRDIFHKYGSKAAKVLEALLEKYTHDGISQLENRKVLTLDPFRQMGSPANIAKLFGGNKQYFSAVEELKKMIYNIA